MLQSLFSQFSSFGFSGSRSSAEACGLAVASFASVPASASVLVGCASGVDSVIRAAALARPVSLRVFQARDYPSYPHRSAFALRSVGCVSAVFASEGLFCSFPASDCPSALRPSIVVADCFSGSGSGSWASLCYALGLGCACFVVLPAGVTAPAWFGAATIALSDTSFYFAPRPPAPLLF